jgi:pentapeptide MXKDX repeat protein
VISVTSGEACAGSRFSETGEKRPTAVTGAVDPANSGLPARRWSMGRRREDSRMIMVKRLLIGFSALALACSVAATVPALAQSDMAKDSMSKDTMSKDTMSKDSMAKDSMAKDSKSKDAMKGSMTKDSMSKDKMSGDSMKSDMAKDPMK